jgi:hypothetical protein
MSGLAKRLAGHSYYCQAHYPPWRKGRYLEKATRIRRNLRVRISSAYINLLADTDVFKRYIEQESILRRLGNLLSDLLPDGMRKFDQWRI